MKCMQLGKQGGSDEEQLKQNEENAYKLGAVKYVTLDVTPGIL